MLQVVWSLIEKEHRQEIAIYKGRRNGNFSPPRGRSGKVRHIQLTNNNQKLTTNNQQEVQHAAKHFSSNREELQ